MAIGYYKKKNDFFMSSFLKAIEHCGKSVRNSLGTNLGLNQNGNKNTHGKSVRNSLGTNLGLNQNGNKNTQYIVQ